LQLKGARPKEVIVVSAYHDLLIVGIIAHIASAAPS
jgi:hypothetical protein